MTTRYRIKDDRTSALSMETNPAFMEGAWASFAAWVINAPDVIARWEKETGRKMAGQPRTPMDAAIDKATGYDKARSQDLEDFLIWATINLWGEDEAPAKMRAAIARRRDGASSPGK